MEPLFEQYKKSHHSKLNTMYLSTNYNPVVALKERKQLQACFATELEPRLFGEPATKEIDQGVNSLASEEFDNSLDNFISDESSFSESDSDEDVGEGRITKLAAMLSIPQEWKLSPLECTRLKSMHLLFADSMTKSRDRSCIDIKTLPSAAEKTFDNPFQMPLQLEDHDPIRFWTLIQPRHVARPKGWQIKLPPRLVSSAQLMDSLKALTLIEDELQSSVQVEVASDDTDNMVHKLICGAQLPRRVEAPCILADANAAKYSQKDVWQEVVSIFCTLENITSTSQQSRIVRPFFLTNDTENAISYESQPVNSWHKLQVPTVALAPDIGMLPQFTLESASVFLGTTTSPPPTLSFVVQTFGAQPPTLTLEPLDARQFDANVPCDASCTDTETPMSTLVESSSLETDSTPSGILMQFCSDWVKATKTYLDNLPKELEILPSMAKETCQKKCSALAAQPMHPPRRTIAPVVEAAPPKSQSQLVKQYMALKRATPSSQNFGKSYNVHRAQQLNLAIPTPSSPVQDTAAIAISGKQTSQQHDLKRMRTDDFAVARSNYIVEPPNQQSISTASQLKSFAYGATGTTWAKKPAAFVQQKIPGYSLTAKEVASPYVTLLYGGDILKSQSIEDALGTLIFNYFTRSFLWHTVYQVLQDNDNGPNVMSQEQSRKRNFVST